MHNEVTPYLGKGYGSYTNFNVAHIEFELVGDGK